MNTKKSLQRESHPQLEPVLATLDRAAKSIEAFRKTIVQCTVAAVDTGAALIDPFQLRTALGAEKLPAFLRTLDPGVDYKSLQEWCENECDKIQASFEPRLRALCQLKGFPCAGHIPVLDIDGFLTVQVNLGKQQAIIGQETHRTLLVDALFPTLEKIIAEERTREFIAGTFLGQLRRGYDRVVASEHLMAGEAAPIRRVYQEVAWLRQSTAFVKSGKKTLYHEYTPIHFGRDLGRLLASELIASSDGKLLSLTPTAFPAEGLEVRQQGATRIYGRLAFSSAVP